MSYSNFKMLFPSTFDSISHHTIKKRIYKCVIKLIHNDDIVGFWYWMYDDFGI
jgi:hypothetical protein